MYPPRDNANFDFHTYRHLELLEKSQHISGNSNSLKTFLVSIYQSISNRIGQQQIIKRQNTKKSSTSVNA